MQLACMEVLEYLLFVRIEEIRWIVRSFYNYRIVIDDMQHLGEDVQETCQLEIMKGRCRWRSEVMVMTSARWGRMKTGRCLEIHSNALAALGHDPMFLGCSEDVLHVMDQKCSGRASCDVRIPDELDDIKPCYPDLTRYLEYSYSCVKGMACSICLNFLILYI